MVHIITHNDLDGYSAGYIVLQHFSKENCNIEHFNYDREPDIEKYGEGDTVVITDYSLSNDQYRQILAQIGETGDLIWLDHHITAIKRYNEEADLYTQGIRSTKWCGAALTWFYFNGFDTEDVENIPYEELVEKLPLWLRLVDAWDTWKLYSKYRTYSEYLNISVGSRLSMELITDMVDNLRYYIDTGISYAEYRDQWSKQLRDKYMFKKKISGKNFGVDRDIEIAVLNIGCANSMFFGEEINNVDVCVTMCFDGEKWIVSMYSNKTYIDCSMCAKIFNGGGHKGAAGCVFNQLTPPDFILNNKC